MKLRLSLFVLIMITGQCFGQSNNLYCYKPSKTMINRGINSIFKSDKSKNNTSKSTATKTTTTNSSSDAVKQNKIESVANLKPCKGIGSYKIGDVYNKNNKLDKRFPNDGYFRLYGETKVNGFNTTTQCRDYYHYPYIEEKFNPVLFFNEGCRIWTTKKTNKIYQIALLGKDRKSQDDIKYAIEFLEKHYEVKPVIPGVLYSTPGSSHWNDDDGEIYCRFDFANGVEIRIRYTKGIINLVCKSRILENLHKQEWEEYHKEMKIENETHKKNAINNRFKNMDSSGLD